MSSRRVTHVDVAALRRHLGDRITVASEVLLEPLDVAGVGIDTTVPVAFDVEVEAVHGGIEVVGSVSGRWLGTCRRCLDAVGGSVTVDVRELFEDSPTEGETYPIEREAIDLVPLLRDAMLAGLPVAPLCNEKCGGPRPADYPVGVDAGEGRGEEHQPIDPRWAALDVLRAPPADSDGGGRLG